MIVRRKLTYANVMATLALFASLGGVSYAATKLPNNSVGAKQLKAKAVTAEKLAPGAVGATALADGSVTGSKLADGSVTGSKVVTSSLGTVPNATHAASAGEVQSASTAHLASRVPTAAVAASIPAPEAEHVVGSTGQPPFETGWISDNNDLPVSFYEDDEGIVHLSGFALRQMGNASTIFTLPPEYRPEGNLTFLSGGEIQLGGTSVAVVPVRVESEGAVAIPAGDTLVDLAGLTWRAAGK